MCRFWGEKQGCSLLRDPSPPPCFLQVANDIRHVMARKCTFGSTTVLEIPGKDSPYDPAKDPIMGGVEQLLGSGEMSGLGSGGASHK